MVMRSSPKLRIVGLPEDILRIFFTVLHPPFQTFNRRALRDCTNAFSLALTCDKFLQVARRLYITELQTLDVLRPIHSTSAHSLIPQLTVGESRPYYEEVDQYEYESTNLSLSLLPKVAGPALVSAHLPSYLQGPSLLTVLSDLAISCPNLEQLYFHDGRNLLPNDVSFFKSFKKIRQLQICSPSSSSVRLLSHHMPSLCNLRFIDLKFNVLPAVFDTIISRTQHHNQSPSFSPITTLQLAMEFRARYNHKKEIECWSSFVVNVEKQRMQSNLIPCSIRVGFGQHLQFRSLNIVVPIIFRSRVFESGRIAMLRRTSIRFDKPLEFTYRLHENIDLNSNLESSKKKLAQANVLLLQAMRHSLHIDKHRYGVQFETFLQECCNATIMWLQPVDVYRNFVESMRLLKFASVVLPLTTTIVSVEISNDLITGTLDVRSDLTKFLATCQSIKTIVLKAPRTKRRWGVNKTVRFFKNISHMVSHFHDLCPELSCLYIESLPLLAYSFEIERQKTKACRTIDEVERTMPHLDMMTLKHCISRSGYY